MRGAQTWGKGASQAQSAGGGEEASVPGGLWKRGVPVQPRRARGGQKGVTVPWFQASTRNPVLRTNQGGA